MARGQLRIESDDDAQQTEVDAALAAVGLVASTPLAAEETFALWPENLPTYLLWQAVQTQWRTGGMGGATGLDYTGVQSCMALRGIRKKDRAQMFESLQAMENATLAEWDKKK